MRQVNEMGKEQIAEAFARHVCDDLTLDQVLDLSRFLHRASRSGFVAVPPSLDQLVRANDRYLDDLAYLEREEGEDA